MRKNDRPVLELLFFIGLLVLFWLFFMYFAGF